jgi:hypothetical protein
VPKLSFSDSLALVALAATFVLVVLDKAGKVKGPVVYWLLIIAAGVCTPFIFGNPWVSGAPSLALKISRGLLAFSIWAILYSSLAVWISGENIQEAFLATLESEPAGKSTGTAPGSTLVEQSPIPTHTLLARFTPLTLPIRIAPGDTAYILQLNPEIKRWAWEIPNTTTKAITWPSDLRIKKGGPPGDLIYACELTNNEDRVFMDVSVSFDVSFHELAMIPVKVTHDKTGTHYTYKETHRAGQVVIGIGSKEEAKVAEDGALVSQFAHSTALPSIAPGSTSRIYLINQSKYISKFTIPRIATAIVAGDSKRVTVTLVRPDVTVNDAVRWFGLGPATYHWKGVPGAP